MPYTLLLADDSVTIQRVIELTFADEDVTVIAVSDGDQAIARLEAAPPDIVLADIGMPGKNGYEVAQYIRQSPRLAHIPVVLLTGAFEPVDQARANAAGCDGVLAKPFEPQLVISRVKDLLARGHSGPDAPGPIPTHETAGDLTLPSSSDSIWSTPRMEQQRPGAPVADVAAAAATGPVPRTELNDYFDRLDAAFSTMANTPAPTAAPAAAPLKQALEPAPFEIDTNIDWFAGKAQGAGGAAEPWDLPAPQADDVSAVDLPLAYAPSKHEMPGVPAPEAHSALAPPFAPEIDFVEPSEPLEREGVRRADDVPAPPAPVAAAPVLALPMPNPPPLPALADAFAALLAAEQADPDAGAGLWPGTAPSAAAVTEDLIEDVARRVLARLSDTVVREAVAEATSKVAEQLVLEEIARIKASIK